MPKTPNQLFNVPDTYDWSIFANRLKTMMDSYGYNMSTLGAKTNLNITSISRYLQGKRPDIIAIRRIADHFNVTIDWLVGRIPDRYNNLTEEQQKILNLYTFASPADKVVVQTILSKYDV
jgi:transcriptional regulator with XRE-family HTH domain